MTQPQIIEQRSSCNECPQFLTLKMQLESHEKESDAALREIPGLVAQKNKNAGALTVIALVATIALVALFSLLALFKAEIRDTIVKMDTTVSKISSNVNDMATNTAVLSESVRLSMQQAEKERLEIKTRAEKEDEDIKRKIDVLEDNYSRELKTWSKKGR